MSARCVDCGAKAEKQHDGTLVIRHVGGDCDQEESPALVMRELLGIRDIPVQTPWSRFIDESGRLLTEDIEVHIQAKMNDISGSYPYHVEARGIATSARLVEDAIVAGALGSSDRKFARITFAQGSLVMTVYPNESDGGPDLAGGIDVSPMYLLASFPRFDVEISESTLHVIHRPSATLPSSGA